MKGIETATTEFQSANKNVSIITVLWTTEILAMHIYFVEMLSSKLLHNFLFLWFIDITAVYQEQESLHNGFKFY